MPISPEEIPVLIKTAQTKVLQKWKRDFYDKTCRELQVHTKGQLFTKVDTLFPHEHPDSKKHCITTYEPITKASIWKGINNLTRIFGNSSFSFNVSDELRTWIVDYEHEGKGLIEIFLEMWVSKAVAEDPNGMFIIYPPDYAQERGMCPLQFVRSELIRSVNETPEGTKYVAFISEMDSQVEYKMETCATKRHVYWDDTVQNYNSKNVSETTYNQRLQIKVIKEVVHLVTAEGLLVYSRRNGNEFDIQVTNFADTLSGPPAFSAGGTISDKADVALFESFVHPFVPFGNLALLQHRNHRAVDLQFSYPRMSELQTPCEKCAGGKIKVRKSAANPLGLQDCDVCKGGGFVTVQSPYKSYSRKYDPNDSNENAHLKIPPVEFFAPDTNIVKYSKDEWRDYLKMAEEAIFVMQKIYTGQVQSAESKNIDLDDLYAWLLNISKMFYGNLRSMLQFLEEYIVRSPVTVSVEKPYSFAILTEDEAFLAMSNILASDSPVFVKANRVDDFISKFVSKSSPVAKALNVLKQYDPLLFYSTKDIQVFKSANTITQMMWTNHILGYPVLLKLYEQDRTLFEQSTDSIMKAIDAGIAEFGIVNTNTTLADSIRRSLGDFNPAAA